MEGGSEYEVRIEIGPVDLEIGLRHTPIYLNLRSVGVDLVLVGVTNGRRALGGVLVPWGYGVLGK